MALIKRIKDKLKVINEKLAKKVKAPSAKIPAVKKPPKQVLGAQQVAVEQSKFSHPETTFARRVMPHELPHHYDKDRMVLQVRDPWWLHTYWEIRHATIERYKSELGSDFFHAKRVLRVYDVTNLIFNGSNAHKFSDIHINDHATSWYIDTAGPGRSWCVDYGLLLPDGRFITILRSNVVQTPLDGPSWITDEEWMIPDDMFARLYGLGFGFGQSSPVGKGWQERVKREISITSGIASMGSGSPVRKKERSFWFMVDCELIVYGATEPDAKVTVQGKPITLRHDGTFTLRFSLPDGQQVIPCKAVSADEIEERTITPIVSRETKVATPIIKNA